MPTPQELKELHREVRRHRNNLNQFGVESLKLVSSKGKELTKGTDTQQPTVTILEDFAKFTLHVVRVANQSQGANVLTISCHGYAEPVLKISFQKSGIDVNEKGCSVDIYNPDPDWQISLRYAIWHQHSIFEEMKEDERERDRIRAEEEARRKAEEEAMEQARKDEKNRQEEMDNLVSLASKLGLPVRAQKRDIPRLEAGDTEERGAQQLAGVA